ncbi:hypothetical protein R1sor_015507 [Riccia sorocarpa]|uniref:Reverse transcriptase zinc-binding domain-containing protein n=1 Tax=Riccia sorocarpa TaxID=122646 RepID=A0ABD3HCV0_9MARC
MLRSWKKAKSTVIWNAERGSYPAHISLQQTITLKHWGESSARSDTAGIIALLKRGGIFTMADGKRVGELDGGWLQHLRSRGSRAKEIGVSTGFCDRCEGQVETIEHIFWHCREARLIREKLAQLGAIDPGCDSLIRWIDDCLDKGRTNVAFVNLLANFLDAQ